MAANGKAVLINRTEKWKKRLFSRVKAEKILALIVYLFLGFITGNARIFDTMAPFGVAMVSACKWGVGGVMSLIGAGLGYIMAGETLWCIRYLAALVLVYTYSFIFRSTHWIQQEWFLPISTGVLLFISGMLCCTGTLGQITVILPFITESVLCVLGGWLFASAISFQEVDEEKQELQQKGGSFLIIACFLVSISQLQIGNILNLGRFFAVLAVLTSAYCGGVQSGSTAGIISGVAVDLAGAGTPFFTMCYAFSASIAGAVCRCGRLLFLLCFISASMVMVFWQWNSQNGFAVLYEILAASLCFLMIPSRGLTIGSSYLKKPTLGAGELGLRRHTARRAKEMANAFRELYDTVRSSAESCTNDSDVAAIYDRTAEAICAACSKKSDCWHRNYVDTLTMLNDATSCMKHKGFLEKADLPDRFVEKCTSLDMFLDAVNQELRMLIYRRRLKIRLSENRTAAYGQFQYLAGVLDAMAEDLKRASGPEVMIEKRILRYLNSKDIDAEVAVFRDHSSRLHILLDGMRLGNLYRENDYMDKLSALAGTRMCRPAYVNQDEGRMVLLEAEPLAVSVGVAAVKKEGESVSGDRGTYFKTEQGVLCVLLSDGMGSGEKAAKESISVVRILERFLRAGIEPGMAMKILNSVMLLRNGENWGYATVDLMCIDLFTGRTVFYKYGAAPSYVRHGNTIRRVKGISMAAGSMPGEGEPPDIVRINLKPGGVAIIASDGVVSKDNDEWLRSMLADFSGNDTRELARRVVREAGKLFGYSDDMTVLVVRLEERK